MIRAALVVLLLTVVFCLTAGELRPMGHARRGGARLDRAGGFPWRGAGDSGEAGARASIAAVRILHFIPFAGITVWEILIGSVRVAAIVIGIRKLEHPGIVAVPIGDRSKFGVMVTGITTSLSPGSIVLDVDWDRNLMLVHVIDATRSGSDSRRTCRSSMTAISERSFP